MGHFGYVDGQLCAGQVPLAGIATRYALSVPDAERFPLFCVGTPGQLRERLAERIAQLGVGYVVLQFPTPEALERFAEAVLPALRR